MRFTQGLFDEENAPLAGVTMREVLAMTEFLNRVKLQDPSTPEQNTYGIPFLVEHDFALRAGSNTLFHFGDTTVARYLTEYAVTQPRDGDVLDYSKLTESTLSKLPNRLGLFNIIGHLGEYAMMTEAEQAQDAYPNCWLLGGKLDDSNPNNTCKSWYVERTAMNTIFVAYNGVRLGLFTNR